MSKIRFGLFVAAVLLTLAGFISVRADAAQEPGPGKFVLDSKLTSMVKAGVGPVVFPHAQHQAKFKCGICHPAIFKDKAKANDISMKKNMNGEFCGSPNCHNSPNAFPLFDCEKCHTKVKTSGKK